MVRYVAKKPLLIGTKYRQPGEEVPEAATWPNLRFYVQFGYVESVEGDSAAVREADAATTPVVDGEGTSASVAAGGESNDVGSNPVGEVGLGPREEQVAKGDDANSGRTDQDARQHGSAPLFEGLAEQGDERRTEIDKLEGHVEPEEKRNDGLDAKQRGHGRHPVKRSRKKVR